MIPSRWPVVAVMALLVVGCAPAGGAPSGPASSTSVSSPTITSRTEPEASRSETRTVDADASLPMELTITSPLLEGGAESVVEKLHEVSGFRPALKLDITKDEVTLIVLDTDKQSRGYRWRDDIIESAVTDVQYLGQTIFWPTDLVLNNVQLIFDNAALLGTSGDAQVLQVVEYRPGSVYMSVTTTPESDTIFFRRDGSVFRSLGTTAVADIREGIAAVTGGSDEVFSVGFSAGSGYVAELPTSDGTIERRSRVGNRPAYVSQRSGTSPLEPWDPDLIDAAAVARSISFYDTGTGCAVEIDHRFKRVQPVLTYTCGSETYHSDMQGRDLTAQLR